LQIIEKISHPKYEQDKKDYDIALLKLERKIKYTDYRRPACLYRKQELPAEMVATGWGKTENGTLSQDLLKVTLPEVPFVECNKYYKYSVSLNPKYMFCAGGLNTGADTCQVIVGIGIIGATKRENFAVTQTRRIEVLGIHGTRFSAPTKYLTHRHLSPRTFFNSRFSIWHGMGARWLADYGYHVDEIKNNTSFSSQSAVVEYFQTKILYSMLAN